MIQYIAVLNRAAFHFKDGGERSMQSRGPLMIEHRLIERMIESIRIKLKGIEVTKRVDPIMIDRIVDFIRVYADRTHHGKEEDILFKKLEEKAMSEQDRQLMEELIADHLLGRKTTRELIEANMQYRNGNQSALKIISAKLNLLADFYPKHIEKEDKIFFPAYMKYVSKKEDQLMLSDFWQFDRNMIHEKYKAVIMEMKG
jgi:hemerythrin-like domain-containing protein